MFEKYRRLGLATAAVALVTGLGLATAANAAPTSRGHRPGHGANMNIQLLSINDFHGNLEPPQGSSGTVTASDGHGGTVQIPAGGVEYLATHLKQARHGHRNSITVAAGDIIGASPLLSAAFHDEPTVEAMNKIGLEVTSVGNHEFDEGSTELLRMQHGGCRTDDGCYDPQEPFTGADFQYLSANVVREDTGRTLLPPYWVKRIHGAKIGFIGMTLEGTPDIVTAEGVKGLKFLDEVETANKVVPLLRKQGVKSIVVLLHEGGYPSGSTYDYDCDSGGPGSGISGPIVDIAKKLDPQIDVVITGHTHQSYVCTIPDPAGRPRLVTSGSSFGRLYTEISLNYNRRTRDISRSSVSAHNVVVTQDVAKDAPLTDLVTRYQDLVAPIANKEVGYVSADIPGGGAGTPESPLGDAISDAQLEATAAGDAGGAQIAFMNPGGIRSDVTYAPSGSEGDGVVTYGEAFSVQPFNNYLTTMDLTGAQILTLLQQQFSAANAESPKVLQVSDGFTYTVDNARSGADKVVADSVKLDGTPLDPAASYRVTVNNFMAGGGDGFPVLTEGANRLDGGYDIDAFTAYLTAHSSAASPFPPPAADRITFVN
ncbi:MAG: bifunctional metallophosphatase/5'-nucleotidase [Actinocatenispora sp.]